jgi:acylphosphatase
MKNSGSDLASLHALIKGWVQGVYFRDFVRHHAMALGLTGYVRNVRHPRVVEVRAEGERSKLREMVKLLHRGPTGARVEGVEVEWGDYTGDYSAFTIAF